MTVDELKTRVLQKLRVIAAGATGDTGDLALVEDKYLEVYEELNNEGLVDWEAGTSATVTTTHSQHVIDIVASRCADDFEVDEARLQRLAIQEPGALKKLKRLSHQAYVSQDTAESY